MASSDENTEKLEVQLTKLADKVEAKLDKVTEHLSSIDATLARNTASLEIHVKRTDLLEAQIEPLKTHVQNVTGAIKFLKILGLIITILAAIHVWQ